MLTAFLKFPVLAVNVMLSLTVWNATVEAATVVVVVAAAFFTEDSAAVDVETTVVKVAATMGLESLGQPAQPMLISPGQQVGPTEPLGPIQPQAMEGTLLPSTSFAPVTESGQTTPVAPEEPAEETEGQVRQVGFLSRLTGGGQPEADQKPAETQPKRSIFSPLFR